MFSSRPRRAICVLLLAISWGCREPNQFVPPPPPEVTVAHPIEKAVTDTIEFVGITEPTQVVDLRARVNGYLEKIQYKDGSDVEAGKELFLIEQAPYQAVLDAAKAANQRAIASLSLAKSQYRRMEPLRANGVVTQEELDVQAAQVETSQADVAAAEAAMRKAELDLGYTKVMAPISGRIGRHMVDIGNLVRAEETQLAIIRVLDPIYAIFDVSENDLLRFMAMRRNDELPDPEKNPPVLHLGLANEEGFPHEGRLDYREMIVQSGTSRRRGIFPNPGWQLIPGMQVRIQAAIGDPKPKLLVEERAVGSDQRGDYLLVVDDKNVVQYRPVKLGIHVDRMRVIESGVMASDWVIVNGLQRARAGTIVKPVPAETKTDSSSEAGSTLEAPGASPPVDAATKDGNASKVGEETSPDTKTDTTAETK
jgi:RND family efflux transporter MFP subunit